MVDLKYRQWIFISFLVYAVLVVGYWYHTTTVYRQVDTLDAYYADWKLKYKDTVQLRDNVQDANEFMMIPFSEKYHVVFHLLLVTDVSSLSQRVTKWNIQEAFKLYFEPLLKRIKPFATFQVHSQVRKVVAGIIFVKI